MCNEITNLWNANLVYFDYKHENIVFVENGNKYKYCVYLIDILSVCFISQTPIKFYYNNEYLFKLMILLNLIVACLEVENTNNCNIFDFSNFDNGCWKYTTLN